jgi:hypothetical protein
MRYRPVDEHQVNVPLTLIIETDPRSMKKCLDELLPGPWGALSRRRVAAEPSIAG